MWVPGLHSLPLARIRQSSDIRREEPQHQVRDIKVEDHSHHFWSIGQALAFSNPQALVPHWHAANIEKLLRSQESKDAKLRAPSNNFHHSSSSAHCTFALSYPEEAPTHSSVPEECQGSAIVPSHRSNNLTAPASPFFGSAGFTCSRVNICAGWIFSHE